MALIRGALPAPRCRRERAKRSAGYRRVAAMIAGCALAGSPLSAVAWADDQADARHAYNTGNLGDAFRLWSKLAGEGNPNAAFSLGLMHDLGQATPPDPSAAFNWYLRAAEAGIAAAEFNVAVMLDSGRGVPRDKLTASVWYGRAAARGNARAQYNLAQLYADGDGVPRNVSLAQAWLRMAAAEVTAATGRLATLALGAASEPRPGSSPAADLVPAVAAAPPDRAAVPLTDAGACAELVWLAPPEPVAIRYFVQVVMFGQHGVRDVFADFSDLSAMLVSPPNESASYAWRVYVVDKNAPRYVPGAWRRFSVAKAPGTGC